MQERIRDINNQMTQQRQQTTQLREEVTKGKVELDAARAKIKATSLEPASSSEREAQLQGEVTKCMVSAIYNNNTSRDSMDAYCHPLEIAQVLYL